MIHRYADQQRAAAELEELEDLIHALDTFGFWWTVARLKVAQRKRQADLRTMIRDGFALKILRRMEPIGAALVEAGVFPPPKYDGDILIDETGDILTTTDLTARQWAVIEHLAESDPKIQQAISEVLEMLARHVELRRCYVRIHQHTEVPSE